MATLKNRNNDQVELTADYLCQRRIPAEVQQRLGIHWISYEMATSDRYGFGQLATSPDGVIAFPLSQNGEICAVKNWYDSPEREAEHLGRLNRYRLNKGLSLTQKPPKYLLPCGDRARAHPFYDPFSLMTGASNGHLPPVLFCTEDVIGCIKAAMAGKRVLSSFGVWLVLREDLENLQADVSWLHPYQDQIPAYFADSDALEKASVLQAVIRTGYGLTCPVGLFPSPDAIKVGLDEYMDAGGDLEALADQVLDVAEFVQVTLPQIAPRLVQLHAASQAANLMGAIYEAVIRELARHVQNIASFKFLYAEPLKKVGLTMTDWKPIFLSTRPSRALADSARLLAKALLEGPLKQTLRFESKLRIWYTYDAQTGCWDQTQKETVSSLVDRSVEAILGTPDFDYNLKEDATKFVRDQVEIKQWPAAPKLLNFENGALDVSWSEPVLLDHDPAHSLTYCLPRPYVQIANGQTPTIDEFQQQLTGGQQGEIDKLNCFAAAVLRGMVELQVYQALIGDPGAGKGTWINFLTELIGSQACYATTLDMFCGNQFDCGNCYGRRLVIFNDADQYNGNLGKFLNFTGGDYVRGEIKGGASFNFRADGFIILTANRPVFVRSHPGLNRRTVLVQCARPVGRRPDPTLISKLCDELEAYTDRLLQIPTEQIQQVLLDRGKSNPRERLLYWQHLCETDAIAAWAEEHLSQGEADSFERIGRFRDDPERLFGSYVQFCHQTGRTPKAVNTFSTGLLHILTDVLGWSVKRQRKRISVSDHPHVFFGVRLKYAHDPNISEILEANLSASSPEA